MREKFNKKKGIHEILLKSQKNLSIKFLLKLNDFETQKNHDFEI